eukprot:TRINITY_DN79462_c0_g1_i1.p1 TRINITY_DN79462_c0_g1~~TRINITY_DN79462_c0_g1_i1.p1  ORF type:complete len:202 (-),score=35.79 TRINITY_DN79462_c0_g1_i1:115-720(-)
MSTNVESMSKRLGDTEAIQKSLTSTTASGVVLFVSLALPFIHFSAKMTGFLPHAFATWLDVVRQPLSLSKLVHKSTSHALTWHFGIELSWLYQLLVSVACSWAICRRHGIKWSAEVWDSLFDSVSSMSFPVSWYLAIAYFEETLRIARGHPHPLSFELDLHFAMFALTFSWAASLTIVMLCRWFFTRTEINDLLEVLSSVL